VKVHELAAKTGVLSLLSVSAVGPWHVKPRPPSDVARKCDTAQRYIFKISKMKTAFKKIINFQRDLMNFRSIQ
jgi:hypothetical protein